MKRIQFLFLLVFGKIQVNLSKINGDILSQRRRVFSLFPHTLFLSLESPP